METEAKFEKELVEYLCTGVIDNIVAEPVSSYGAKEVQKTKLWKYEPSIKTTEGLWENFKTILERRNQNTLNNPLSVNEFNQVKNQIEALTSPYLAGQFLYGHNGVSEVEVDLDDGRHVYLNVFDQAQIGAGNTHYQVVTQIQRPAKLPGRQPRRFDTTLLINGLPIIQIEEKTTTHNVEEALNQMEQYIAEDQYRDIFSTLQILVAMTPNNIRYMANTTRERFNTDFAFRWQTRDCKNVNDWKQFSDLFLSIPMAHKMATNYMILDGTPSKQAIKVMRPYQVYATEKVLDKIKKMDFDCCDNKIGYVWHTTGSGKTITSFKTAWLARTLPNVEKVVFVVDRIALTKQTFEAYKAYDPTNGLGLGGTSDIQDTENRKELEKKLKSKDNQIIVTSIQKLDRMVTDWNDKKKPAMDKRIVFIVDEAHRSVNGDSFVSIKKAFKRGAWVGYTGTPKFNNDKDKDVGKTEEIFGEPLHQYTIREAIADRNVLGFKVDFETTLKEDQIREDYLPKFFKAQNPDWDDEKIRNKIDNMTADDIDDTLVPSIYDEQPEHIRLVVEDVFKNWKNRSNDFKYNALFTTNSGANKSGIDMALLYYKEFQRVNEERKANGEFTLKVGITYSLTTDNSRNQSTKNEGLLEAITNHNKMFNTSFTLGEVQEYTQDVTSRLARNATDGKYYDLVIVVHQLLTGFDAPELNTLYVDRILRNADLIQAYSRTNRIANMQEKPWGRIINYRWPKLNEKLMNEALAVYANKNSASKQGRLDHTGDDSDEADRKELVDSGVLAKEFKDQLEEVKNTVDTLADLTDHFTDVPNSEAQREEMLNKLQEYSRGIAKLKQYDPEDVNGIVEGFDYNNPEQLVNMLGMTQKQEETLTTSLYNQVKELVAKAKDIPVAQLEFAMSHVKDVKVNYDYLTELIQQLLNEVHENKMVEAQLTKEKIDNFTIGMEDRKYAKEINSVVDVIMDKSYPPEGSEMTFPITDLKSSDTIIKDAIKVSRTKIIYDFRIKWGIVDVVSSETLLDLIMNHQFGSENDLNTKGELAEIQKAGSKEYKEKATDPEVAKLSPIRFRNGLKAAAYKLADDIVGVD